MPYKSKGVKKVVNYNSLHWWLRRKYGSATLCESKSCTKKSKMFHYALIKGKEYERNIHNFMQLCQSCHTKYDSTKEGRKRMVAFRTGRPRSYIWKKVYELDDKGKIIREFPSITLCAKEIKMHQGAFFTNHIKNGRKYKGRLFTTKSPYPLKAKKK